MRKFLSVIAMSMALLVSVNVYASNGYTANDLLDDCSNFYTAGYCRAYIHGVAEGFLGAKGTKLERYTTNETGKNVFMAYIRNHPEYGDIPASTIVLDALISSKIITFGHIE